MAETKPTESTPEKNELDSSIEILRDTRDAVMDLLKEKYPNLVLGVRSQMTLLINRLGALSPNRINSEGVTAYKKTPLTTFMGEPLHRGQPVKEEDITPEELEKRNFREKVDRLQKDFNTLSDEQILESFKNEPNVVRGVAKLSGMEEYREKKLNVQYIQSVREHMKQQAEDQAKLDADRKKTAEADSEGNN